MPNEKKSAKHTGMTREAAKAFLETNQVKFVLAQFVDIHGVAKTKAVPVEHFKISSWKMALASPASPCGAWDRSPRIPTTWRWATLRP